MLNNNIRLSSIDSLHASGTFFETEACLPKTRVELRMIKASAAIRMEPKWAEHLNDESKCQEWATHVKNTFNLTDDEVRYIFEELKYYALLKENGVNREEPAAIDKAWICDSASDSVLAKELKLNARALEGKAMATSSAEGQVLVDPFLYPFLAKDSCLLSKPLESPEAALDSCLSRVKPGPTASWPQAITSYNEAQGDISGAFDKRPVANLLRLYGGSKESDSYACWLPTDFYVNDDGTVTIRSYINNLHPSCYVELYKTIAKVFAQFVPLLEQVTTDVTNPRGLRAVFDEKECYKLGEYTVKEFLSKGSRGELPKEYDEILADITIPHTMEYSEGSDTMDKIYLDEYELFSNWKSALEYIEPAPQVFFELRRSLAPRSFARFPLQASVEIFNFNLTPDNPKSFEGEWQAVGRAHERIFAVGLYFFSVENIANASLMLREPLQAISFYCERDVESFYLSHDVASDGKDASSYSQVIGGVEIKDGRYICYPNYYQTKMPSFELADPTKAGHVKCIAFYIVDPTIKVISTEMVPPQQPHWVRGKVKSRDATSVASAELKRDELKSAHEHYNQGVTSHFVKRIPSRTTFGQGATAPLANLHLLRKALQNLGAQVSVCRPDSTGT